MLYFGSSGDCCSCMMWVWMSHGTLEGPISKEGFGSSMQQVHSQLKKRLQYGKDGGLQKPSGGRELSLHPSCCLSTPSTARLPITVAPSDSFGVTHDRKHFHLGYVKNNSFDIEIRVFAQASWKEHQRDLCNGFVTSVPRLAVIFSWLGVPFTLQLWPLILQVFYKGDDLV